MVIPCIVPCKILSIPYLLGNVNINILVFLENFIDSEDVCMVSHLMLFIYFSRPCHPYSSQRKWHCLSFVLGIQCCLLFYNSIIFDFDIFKPVLNYFKYFTTPFLNIVFLLFLKLQCDAIH